MQNLYVLAFATKAYDNADPDEIRHQIHISPANTFDCDCSHNSFHRRAESGADVQMRFKKGLVDIPMWVIFAIAVSLIVIALYIGFGSQIGKIVSSIINGMSDKASVGLG
jgi:hypothetical protein